MCVKEREGKRRGVEGSDALGPAHFDPVRLSDPKFSAARQTRARSSGRTPQLLAAVTRRQKAARAAGPGSWTWFRSHNPLPAVPTQDGSCRLLVFLDRQPNQTTVKPRPEPHGPAGPAQKPRTPACLSVPVLAGLKVCAAQLKTRGCSAGRGSCCSWSRSWSWSWCGPPELKSDSSRTGT